MDILAGTPARQGVSSVALTEKNNRHKKRQPLYLVTQNYDIEGFEGLSIGHVTSDSV